MPLPQSDPDASPVLPGAGARPGQRGGAPIKRRDASVPWRPADRSRRILGLRVDGTSYLEAVEAICDRAGRGLGGAVCVANVHMVVEGLDDPRFQRQVNSAELVTPDGMPLVWGLRALGVAGASRVYGPALTSVLCRRAESLGISVGFYGGRPEVLDELLHRTRRRFPRLSIAFSASPPFRALSEQEEREVSDAIVASGVGILFVGLGCPRQERWMARHREALPCVMLGVGAAFDFLAGAQPQAPAWMQSVGLEWLFRLCSEPRRLWRRYLIGNPRFGARFAAQLVVALASRWLPRRRSAGA